MQSTLKTSKQKLCAQPYKLQNSTPIFSLKKKHQQTSEDRRRCYLSRSELRFSSREQHKQLPITENKHLHQETPASLIEGKRARPDPHRTIQILPSCHGGGRASRQVEPIRSVHVRTYLLGCSAVRPEIETDTCGALIRQIPLSC